NARREEPLGVRVPEPIVGDGPEQQALLADSVGLALLVVLETLEPAERLAFVLHDMFAVPFDQIASIAPRPRPVSSRRVRAGGCAAPCRNPTPTWRSSESSSTRSWPPPATAIS